MHTDSGVEQGLEWAEPKLKLPFLKKTPGGSHHGKSSYRCCKALDFKHKAVLPSTMPSHIKFTLFHKTQSIANRKKEQKSSMFSQQSIYYGLSKTESPLNAYGSVINSGE